MSQLAESFNAGTRSGDPGTDRGTPEQLFFSRRIVDPQSGARLTGTVGRWSLGVLAADDRASGKLLAGDDSMSGDRAVDGVFRIACCRMSRWSRSTRASAWGRICC
jgi:hypothetical protein